MQHVQQPGRRDGRLLVVVDHHEVPGGPRHLGELLLPRLQRVRGLVHHPGRVVPGAGVGRADPEGRDVQVLLVQLRRHHPLRAAVAAAQRVEVHRPQAPLGGTHQQVAQLLAQPPQAEGLGGQVRRQPELRPLAGQVPLQQLREHQVLLRAGDEGGRGLAEGHLAVPQHRERRGRRGAHHRRADRAARAGGDLVAQPGSPASRRREDQDAGRVGARRDRLHRDAPRHRGPPGPGSADHERDGRAAGRLDRGRLGLVQDERRAVAGGRRRGEADRCCGCHGADSTTGLRQPRPPRAGPRPPRAVSLERPARSPCADDDAAAVRPA